LVGEAAQDAWCKHTMLLLPKLDRRTVINATAIIVKAKELVMAGQGLQRTSFIDRSIRSAEAYMRDRFRK
jgi:hypothetical protein